VEASVVGRTYPLKAKAQTLVEARLAADDVGKSPLARSSCTAARRSEVDWEERLGLLSVTLLQQISLVLLLDHVEANLDAQPLKNSQLANCLRRMSCYFFHQRSPVWPHPMSRRKL
jgi:hypothetical protein